MDVGKEYAKKEARKIVPFHEDDLLHPQPTNTLLYKELGQVHQHQETGSKAFCVRRFRIPHPPSLPSFFADAAHH
jgi:hypothetical protein